ncbi:hypothetical protein [Mycetocola sp. JXN-3]|uniref:hypothetical protein n=1 Tax=Mycetocola sp. JXN-3 TaxID=2116510 RepID=UPI00165D14F9|nr:hypothetical protein [Mycetocola sp. JXN-3]
MLTTSTPRLADTLYPIPFVPPHPGPFDAPFLPTIAEPIVPAVRFVTTGAFPIPAALWPCLLWLLLSTPGLIRLDLRERRLPNRLVVPAALLLAGGVIVEVIAVATGSNGVLSNSVWQFDVGSLDAGPLGAGSLNAGPVDVGTRDIGPDVVGPLDPGAASARDGPMGVFARLIPAVVLAIIALSLAAFGFWGGGDGKLAAVCLAALSLTTDPVGALSLFALLCGFTMIVISCHPALKRIRARQVRRGGRGASPPVSAKHPDTPSGGILTHTIPLGPVLLGGLWGTLLTLVVTGLPM